MFPHLLFSPGVAEVILPWVDHGLVMAYAEAKVKPVVSDFDTFTVGSRGMKYEPLGKEEQALAIWHIPFC